LAAREVICWTGLRDQTVLPSHYAPGRELEDLLNAKLTSLGDRPRIKRHDVSRGVIKSLIAVGFGISLVLESDIGAKFFRFGLWGAVRRDRAEPYRLFSGPAGQQREPCPRKPP
jgi:hypothetical protein